MSRVRKLEKIFKIVKRWLISGESKNCVLLSFNLISLLNISKVCLEHPSILKDIPAIYFLVACMLASSVISLSLLLVDVDIHRKNEKWINHSNNLINYWAIDNHSFESYKIALSNRYDVEDNLTKYEEDLARQIVRTSKIAVKKYKKFRKSMILLSIGFAVFMLNLIFLAFLNIFLYIKK